MIVKRSREIFGNFLWRRPFLRENSAVRRVRIMAVAVEGGGCCDPISVAEEMCHPDNGSRMFFDNCGKKRNTELWHSEAKFGKIRLLPSDRQRILYEV